MKPGDRIGTATVIPSRREPLPASVTDAAYVCVTVPVRTKNPLNNRQHWSKDSRDAKVQRDTTALALIGVDAGTWAELAKGCTVRMTRLSSGRLDEDNLRAALKHIRDVVAQKLFGGDIGRRDDNPAASWEYRQLTSPRGVFGVIVRVGKRTG